MLDKLFENEIEPWQRDTIRLCVEDIVQSKIIASYSKLSQEIKNITGKSISADTLKRFAKDKNYNSDAPLNTRVKTLNIIVEYLIHEDVEYLSKELLTKEKINLYTPSALVEFFNPSRKVSSLKVNSYEGIFEKSVATSNEDEEITVLQFSHVSGLGYFKIVEIIWKKNEFFEGSTAFNPIITVGWGISAFQDNILIILKNSKTKHGYSYINVGETGQNSSSGRVEQMLLICNRQPILSNWLNIKDKFSARNIDKNLLHFKRSESFPCFIDDKMI